MDHVLGDFARRPDVRVHQHVGLPVERRARGEQVADFLLRVGGVEQLRADFRLVAATHKDLRALMASGQFRADLFYRISAFPVHLPALRDRSDDIPTLVRSMLERAERGSVFQVADPAMALMQTYGWPGNIRELKNVMDRACLLADDFTIRVEHLPMELREPAQGDLEPRVAVARGHALELDDRGLLAMASEFRGSRKALAQRLGMSGEEVNRIYPGFGW